MKALVHTYAIDLPVRAPRSAVLENGDGSGSTGRKINVVLTGSTGFLGHYIIEALLSDVKVGKIYCFNKGLDGEEKFRANHSSGRDFASYDTKRIEFSKVGYEKEAYGLPSAVYDYLAGKLDLVIHNAWKVDFNHTLISYNTTHFPALHTLLTWSLLSPRHMKICFMSSISAVNNWPASFVSHSPPSRSRQPDPLVTPVLEHVIDDYNVASYLGYGQSKYVAERILDVAARERGVPAVIFREGQIAGPSPSAVGDELQMSVPWSRSDWVPSMLQSSKALGVLPETLGSADDVDWIPVNKLARNVAEVLNLLRAPLQVPRSFTSSTRPRHLIPKRPGIRSKNMVGNIDVSSLSDWLARLRDVDHGSQADLLRSPALKLQDHFESLDQTLHTPFETRSAKSKSENMRELRAVDMRDMERG